jgi:hypothetical protein
MLVAITFAPGSSDAAAPAISGFVTPALPIELMSPVQRLSAGPDAHGYPLHASLPLFSVPAIPPPHVALPKAWAILVAANGAILLALNLAFVGHLRSAYAAPRRKNRANS